MDSLFHELLGEDAQIHPQLGALVPADQLLVFARALKSQSWTTLLYCCATHFPVDVRGGISEEHFVVSWGLRKLGPGSTTLHFYVRLLPGETCPSLASVWAGEDWQEREQYDLVGIEFSDHPDLRRIMLSEDWEGHPLRRDYAIDTPHFPWR